MAIILNTKKRSPYKNILMASVMTPAIFAASAAIAQDAGNDDVIVVEGFRKTIQDSIELKRENTSIVDGLTADDIDSLPALSIAEALENITSVGSQREGSGATEVSIRGLGPFLGSTVINGREATNGSGDRSVNFSQFPSELFNKIEIYKTQEASLIEGGVAGQISLSTLKPLEYGKRRIQLQAKGNINPDNMRLDNPIRDFGYRLTGSYVDQFDTDAGLFGISVGVQTNVTPNPEQEARSTSTFQSCTIASLDSSSCNGGSPNVSAEDIDDMTGDRIGVAEPFVLTSSSRSFRQNLTDDKRDAIFGAIQWQPNERLEFNADIQYSDRTFTEYRSDILFDANDILEVDTDVSPTIENGIVTYTTAADDLDDEIFPLTTGLDGSLRTATTTGDIEVNSQFSERIEEYLGFGGGLTYDVSDRLRISADGSYSETSRRENQIQARVVSGGTTLIGIEVLQDGTDAHQFTVVDTDVTDPSIFTDDNTRIREDLNQFRNHEIWAVRGDAEYLVDGDILRTIKAGVRFSSQSYDQLPRVRNSFEFDNGGDQFAEFVTEIDGVPVDGSNIAELAATTCANNVFPEPGFLDGEVSGNLITNIDEDGNVIAAGTGNTFVTFNGMCLGETLLGRTLTVPTAADASGAELVQSVDIREETLAAYVQFDYNTELAGLPVRGNVGVRYVDTTLDSNSFRSDLIATVDPMTGFLTGLSASTADVVPISTTFGYSEFLPSFNLVADVREDLLFRAGVFRALSRPDPSDLGNGRTFAILTLDDADIDADTTIADFIGSVTANGNPRLEPFLSWNFDAALEWYPNEDSILAVGVYYKRFNGGFENVAQTETFVVNGESFDTLVPVRTTTNENNRIFGVEVTAAHAFSYLPAPFDGLGFKASYNFADSNFEFEDGIFGAQTIVNSDGSVMQLSGLVPPANLPGLSAHTANGQVYYNIGKLGLQGIVKYRSEYFQQFISTPLNLRFVEDALVFEARIRYKINDNVEIKLEGVNLFNEPRRQFNPTLNNFAEINVYGPRYFAGITAKFQGGLLFSLADARLGFAASWLGMPRVFLGFSSEADELA